MDSQAPGTRHILIADYAYLGDKSAFAIESETFAAHGHVLHFGSCVTEDDIIAQGAGMSAILCCSNLPIGKRTFDALPECRIILRYGIGYNSIDVAEATRQNRIVLYMPGFCLEELATHSVGFTIDLLRSLSMHDRHIRNGSWTVKEGMSPRRLSGMTIGLFGFGGSARLLARIYTLGWGARVIACDPYAGDTGGLNVTLVDFETLLSESDVISIHVPYTPETHHRFNEEAFARMKPTALLINTARGPIVSEVALAKALTSGQIAGAGLDVFETEPLPDNSPLRACDNIVMTPHSAYYSLDSVAILHQRTAASVVEALAGGYPANIANNDVIPKDLQILVPI